jgi:hypothetical protein
LALFAGCQCDSLNEDRKMPKPAPPPSAAPDTTLHIAVTVKGTPRAPIDGAMLAARKPDFEDSERRAWRLVELLGIAGEAPISVTGERGVTVVLQTDPDADAAAPVPVLIMSRRGEVLAAMVDPAEPFPPYHGQGGRRGRRGDPLPRIGGVTRIDVGPPEDAQK